MRFTKAVPEFRLLELPFVVSDRRFVNQHPHTNERAAWRSIPGTRFPADCSRHQGICDGNRFRKILGTGQPADQYRQLRRPHLPPLYYTQRALIWRDGHDLQRGALSKLAAGRTGSRRRGGPGSDGAATAPGCGEDTEVLATLNPHDNEVVHLTDAEHAAFVDCCAAGAHQIPQGT